MIFVNPQFFWVMILPFIIFSFLTLKHKEKIKHVFSKNVLKRLRVGKAGVSLRFRNSILFLALLLMIVAIARPVIERGDKKVEVAGITLLSALDISGSMRAKDNYPNRLEFAKSKMTQLFKAMPSDEIGVVAFAHSSFILAPFTTDKDTLTTMIEGVNDTYINMGSTDFSMLGTLSSELLTEKKPKILVLFSDGGDKEAISDFSEILKEHKIDLYVVLVGTLQGSPVIDAEGKAHTNQDGTIAISQRNDDLKDIAEENNGDFIVASNGKEDIVKLAQILKSKYKNNTENEMTIKDRVEYFYYPLGLALLFLLISFGSIPKFSQAKDQHINAYGEKK